MVPLALLGMREVPLDCVQLERNDFPHIAVWSAVCGDV